MDTTILQLLIPLYKNRGNTGTGEVIDTGTTPTTPVDPPDDPVGDAFLFGNTLIIYGDTAIVFEE